MTSALSRRLDARQQHLAEHMSRPDLVRYVDAPPQMVSQSAVFRDGQLIQPSAWSVEARLIPDGNLRLIALSGLGDAFWTRGVVLETLKAGLKVWLETPFEWVFWDMVGLPGFHFWRAESAPAAHGVRTATYLGQDMRSGQTVYGGMCAHCKVPKGDFRMPVKPEWSAAADELLAQLKPARPVMLYRPLVLNPGRRSVTSRNPDHGAYRAIYTAIRKRFHVVSLASSQGEEIVHADQADTVFHRGEVPVTTLCALMAKADLVYTNPGMALVMAGALGAPVIGVFGGYEDAHNYEDTMVYGPSLLLDPIKPCRCMSDAHACDKRMDMPAAIRRAVEFACRPR